jgi:hypothetical protein
LFLLLVNVTTYWTFFEGYFFLWFPRVGIFPTSLQPHFGILSNVTSSVCCLIRSEGRTHSSTNWRALTTSAVVVNIWATQREAYQVSWELELMSRIAVEMYRTFFLLLPDEFGQKTLGLNPFIYSII